MSREGWGVHAIAEGIRAGHLSSREVVEHYFASIERENPRLNAFLYVNREGALREAARWDDRRARGEECPPLAGVPVAVKDIICTAGMPTTCGSRILAPFVAPYDATAIERLRARGAIVLGKTNMDEFAMGSSNENSAFGPVRNPHDLGRVPGGSSGGSAAAVAAGCAPAALGSDTGGSIRQPAALTGIVGLKPTYGRVSRYGLVAFASSFDQIGPMARDVRDAALLLSAIAGPDPRDSTSAPSPVPDFLATLEDGVAGLRVGIPEEYLPPGTPEAVQASTEEAARALERAGANLRMVRLPLTPYALATYYIIATAEASSNLARYDGARYGHRAQGAEGVREMYLRTRSEGFGPEVKRRIMLGTYVLSRGYYEAYYLKAQRVRNLFAQEFRRAFSEVDLLLCPTAPGPAFRLGEKVTDPVAMYLSDVFTVPANLAGLPAISVPAGRADGLPLGVQLMGPPFAEEVLLRAARALEREGLGGA